MHNAVWFDPTDATRPFKFGTGVAERKFVREEKTPEEIVAFFREENLSFIWTNILYNIESGFKFLPMSGKSTFRNGKMFFKPEHPELYGLPDQAFPMDNDEAFLEKEERKYLCYMFVAIQEEDSDAASCSIECIYDPDSVDGYSELMKDHLAKKFLDYANVKTIHQTVKLGNRGAKNAYESRMQNKEQLI